MSKTVFLFPGQGSQSAGMMGEVRLEGRAAEIFELGSDTVGIDLIGLCTNNPEPRLSDTRFSQLGIFTVSLALYCNALDSGLKPDGVAGHSLGEYTALTAAGVIEAADAFRLIKIRSEIMSEHSSGDGGMCAVIGLPSDQIAEICRSVDGYVIPANYNSPAQTVISGQMEAVESVAAIVKDMKKRAILLDVSGAFHTNMMEDAAEKFKQAAMSVVYKEPETAVYSNLTAERMTDLSDMPSYFARHMTSPVNFCGELQSLQRDGFTDFVEIGPSKVLTGMVGKTLDGVNAVKFANK
ncbi:MAG: ACP S-malonyltransferase [Oscillospiraceae bacterium]|nr:ACP S-malonyltransferase [Oscillospiraceae bacterium]